MKQFYKHFLKNKVFVLLAVLSTIFSNPSFSQVGFNNPNPDSTALIDMKATDKGLLIPRLTTNQRDIMTAGGKKVAHALLVFDTDQNLFFVYDTISNPDQWVVLNPFQAASNTSNITTNTTGNVGIGTSNPNAKLDVNGNIKSSGNITSTTSTVNGTLTANITNTTTVNATGTVTANNFVGNGTIPLGGIIMWSGTTVPAGWALCNGQISNGYQTPNLSGKFIVASGTNTDPSGTYSYTVGATGGESKHAMTLTEMPRHNHTFSDIFQGDKIVGKNAGNGEICASEGEITTGNTTNLKGGDVSSPVEGNGLPFENRPAYYALAFIMRVQ